MVCLVSLTLCEVSYAASYSIAVIDSKNDGTIHATCSPVNKATGGPAEVLLDLDADGTGDLCIGSGTGSCAATVNYDCGGVSGFSLCSTQAGGSFMGGDPTVATNAGATVGPNFILSASSISVTPGPSFFAGFKGASGHANYVGFLEMKIDATTCAYTFGKAYFESTPGAGITFVSTPIGGAAVSAPIDFDFNHQPVKTFTTEIKVK